MRRLHLTTLELVPVEPEKEWVSHYVASAVAQVTEPLDRHELEEEAEDIAQVVAERVRALVVESRNLAVHLELIIAAERRAAVEHLEHQHAERPPVERLRAPRAAHRAR